MKNNSLNNVDVQNMIFFPQNKKINNLSDLNGKKLIKERNDGEAKDIITNQELEFHFVITQLLLNDVEYLYYLEKKESGAIEALTNQQLKLNDLVEWFQSYLNTPEFLLTSSTEELQNKFTDTEIERIAHRNVRNHRKVARALIPEFFSHTQWLYINCKVNGYPAIALVDSAAEITTMTENLAEKVGCQRLIDLKYGGSAKGLGTLRIKGRINLALLMIEDVVLLSSFAIVNTDLVDIIIGLDNLKRHKCSIDFENNVLHIKSTNTKTPFLKEEELPPALRRCTIEQTENC
uniref:Protein ddi1-like protein 1 n=1 Tax=Triatoma infestans TaxID=30076 RepID=A0A161MQ01_TRIIF